MGTNQQVSIWQNLVTVLLAAPLVCLHVSSQENHVCSPLSLIQLDMTPCGVLTMQVKLYKEVQREAGEVW